MRLARSALALLAIGLALAVGSVGAAAADPIVGVWKFASGVEVTIAGSGGSFSGTVTKAVTGGSCPHPAGELMWKISGGGGSYTGSHYGFSSLSTCEHEWQDASWTVADGKLNFFDPGVCGSSPCGTLTRVTPPAAEPARSFSFRVDMRAEAVLGVKKLHRSYVLSKAEATGAFSVEPERAEGSFVVVHDFLHGLYPELMIATNVVRIVRFERTARGISVELEVEVEDTNLKFCKPGTTGTVVLTDLAPPRQDRVALKICSTVLLFVNGSPDRTDSVRVKITKKP